jgi:hypothetical protein
LCCSCDKCGNFQVKNYDGDAADLGLDFVVSEDVLGQQIEHELVHNGARTPVTDSNKLLYVHLCAHWHISRMNSAASAAFARGLSKVRRPPTPILSLFVFSGMFAACSFSQAEVSSGSTLPSPLVVPLLPRGVVLTFVGQGFISM